MIEVQNVANSFHAEKLQAVVLDWAGTTVDFGSRAPIAAILAAFELMGVPVSEAEARLPMGRAKRDHLRELLALPDVANRWQKVHSRNPEETDIDVLYTKFLKLQKDCVARHSTIIPGCCDAIHACRSLGLGIGSSTGYTRDLLDCVAEQAKTEGYEPDVMLSADDISPGRPAPWLCFENARRLGVYPMSSVMKVDDTPVGLTAGRNAGTWCVGVVISGNEVGLSKEALELLSDEEKSSRFKQARQRLVEAGAHLLVDTIAELPQAVEWVNQKLADGETPWSRGDCRQQSAIGHCLSTAK